MVSQLSNEKAKKYCNKLVETGHLDNRSYGAAHTMLAQASEDDMLNPLPRGSRFDLYYSMLCAPR